MPERLCPRCNLRPLEKYRRYCDECRDGGTPAASTPTQPAFTPAQVQVIPVLQQVDPRPVILSCKCTVTSATLWQEMNHHCPKHGDVWVAKIGVSF